MKPIYFTNKVPGYDGPITEWTTICHSKNPWIVIGHSNVRSIGRWGGADRVRKFSVTEWVPHRKSGSLRHYATYYGTLEAAIKAANKSAKENSE